MFRPPTKPDLATWVRARYALGMRWSTESPELRDKERRATAERAANEAAWRRGETLPHPNLWDAVDPTKVDPGASPEAIHRSYLEFTKICRPRPCKRYTI